MDNELNFLFSLKKFQSDEQNVAPNKVGVKWRIKHDKNLVDGREHNFGIRVRVKDSGNKNHYYSIPWTFLPSP